MGNSCNCMKGKQESKEQEFTTASPYNDISKVIVLQNVLRGYIDRKKSVKFNRMKYTKNRTSANQTSFKRKELR